MNRSEALRILGLGDDATSEDVKIAYRETAQILHPDRFASNKKLQERATEQFKNLQEAYDVLTSGKPSAALVVFTARGLSTSPSASSANAAAGTSPAAKTSDTARLAINLLARMSSLSFETPLKKRGWAKRVAHPQNASSR